MEGYCWQQWCVGQCVPPGAVAGGNDVDGSCIYVGRAEHCCNLLPAKVVPMRCNEAVFVCYNGKEVSGGKCEMLCQKSCGQTLKWVASSCGNVPCGAVKVGYTSCGQTLYSGRAKHNGNWCVGMVQPNHGKCYIPFAGEAHGYSCYEVLVDTSCM